MIIHAITSEVIPEAINQDYSQDQEDPNKLAKLMTFSVIAAVCFVAPSIDI
jgi:hypothetical protein